MSRFFLILPGLGLRGIYYEFLLGLGHGIKGVIHFKG